MHIENNTACLPSFRLSLIPYLRVLAVMALTLGLCACAQNFPRPKAATSAPATLDGNAVFHQTWRAHGGDSVNQLSDLNVAIDGDWKFLITEIQPLVTDHRFRIRSEERLLVKDRNVYAAHYRGPAGEKWVYRTPQSVSVVYNGKPATHDDVNRSTALTADSFYLFLLGPLALVPGELNFIRLPDEQLEGQTYLKIYAEKVPGFGFSERDELVFWINKKTSLLYRVHITLEGYETTRGAHVDVSYLNYIKRGPFVFPSRFSERVLGPIKIDAHNWHLTGVDINRGLKRGDIEAGEWSTLANEPANRLGLPSE